MQSLIVTALTPKGREILTSQPPTPWYIKKILKKVGLIEEILSEDPLILQYTMTKLYNDSLMDQYTQQIVKNFEKKGAVKNYDFKVEAV